MRAGDVIGFVGNTGDAQSTPYHLHFEIHPVGLLPMGYDGVVNAVPVPERVAAARGHLVRGRPRLGAARAADATAPEPRRVLLGSTDISSASGLEPGSLERALAAPAPSRATAPGRAGRA